MSAVPVHARHTHLQRSYVRRAFIAVGTLSMANKESKQLAKDLDVLQTGYDIQQQQQPPEPKVKAVIQDLVTLLTS